MQRCVLPIVVAAMLLPLGCASPECVDRDRDHFGEHCEAGSDCDDNDGTRNVDCTLPRIDCELTPYEIGCPCGYPAQHDCFLGDPEQAGVGICEQGYQQCGFNNLWGECRFSTPPGLEVCNGLDDDCDGVIDDGVRSPCGGCNASCVGGVWGEVDTPFEATDVLALTPQRELTLARQDRAAETVWVTNTGEDTVSRIDVIETREVARYDSGGSQPSRVAVDFEGDVWVANRAFDGQSSLTKIASDTTRCFDRDNDGVDTSTAPDDVKPRGQDDCVLFTVPVGARNGVARALAVNAPIGLDDAPGQLWVGLQNEHRVLELNDQTGAVVQSVDTEGFAPFDAAFDPWGVLWLIDRDGYLGRLVFDGVTTTFRTIEVPLSCWQLDAMAIDPAGVITLSGFFCDRVLLFDPATERFEEVPNVVSARGVAATLEHSFVVHTHGRLSVLGRDPWWLEATYDLDDADHHPTETVGLALDGSGDLWAISTQGGLSDNGLATRFDPVLQEVTAQVPVGRLPYAAGDLTGQALRSVVAPEGTASHVFAGCLDGYDTEWNRLHVQWTPGVGSQLRVKTRWAASVSLLQDEPFVDLATLTESTGPLPLPLPAGGALEVELTLVAGSRLGAPRVARIGVEWACGGVD